MTGSPTRSPSHSHHRRPRRCFVSAGRPWYLRGTVIVRPWLVVCVALVSSACIDRGSFACEADEQCQAPGAEGACVAGYCAHPDGDCDSGLRYGRFAAPELAGECTELRPESESGSETGAEQGTSSSSGGASDSGSSSSGAPVPVEVCDQVDNDGDGLVDEWSELNEQCNGCDLYQREGRAYWRCANGRWTDLQPRCEGFGANLASIQDAEENLFLGLRTDSGANWIGINDIGNDGVYTWVDGEPVDYTNWEGVDPPAPNPDANCGGIDTQGEWSIFPCNNGRPGFCEAPHPE